jgi:hypothetical protein
MNWVLIEFKDGERAVVSGNGLRRTEAWHVVAKRGGTGTRTGTGTNRLFGDSREAIEKKVRKCMRAGVRPGLQIRRGPVVGGCGELWQGVF